MIKKLHVGNLSYSVSEEAIKEAFSQIGTVESVIVVKDKISGRSKGFGFVEMSTDAEAAEAIEKLNKSQFEGRTIFVSESKSTGATTPRSGDSRGGNRGPGGFGGNRRSFGNGGGGGDDRRPPRRPR
jgi:RNA recognition motif-containing protein